MDESDIAAGLPDQSAPRFGFEPTGQYLDTAMPTEKYPTVPLSFKPAWITSHRPIIARSLPGRAPAYRLSRLLLLA